ncbi:Rieske (2Fe-2S) protein [Marinobacter sp. SS21]|uniref:Rieske (2Fe-2S) protein n=1 Tax=Marinobacter sp. SS21 TaxID=2979460 RepID=UPI00232EBBE4|nr:Rieske 2Fe-2S domain-containing protein [Marinobacter sp. SS21]MDC0664013.1 Rieske 2Fe-2S domain-containing protein [Marinobacter sp. SS21]
MNSSASWQVVCRREELAHSQVIEFTVNETPGFVLAHQGKLTAFVNRCPHLGIELNWMPGRFLDANQSFIQCATHGALFTIDQGQCIVGPCQGDALTVLNTREQDGEVLVRVPA